MARWTGAERREFGGSAGTGAGSQQLHAFGALALEIARDAGRLGDAGAVDQRFGGAFGRLGFSTWSIISLRRVADGVVSTAAFGRRRRDWDAQYDRRNYAAIDPVVAEMARSSDPFFWSEIASRRGALSPAQRAMFDDARRYGFGQGYGWALHHADGSISGVTLAGEAADAGDPDLRAALHILAIHYEAATRRLRTLAPPVRPARPAPILRRRQAECLQWASVGKTSEEIGLVLSLSPKTVDEHLGNAYRVLDVCTRPQAIARALSLGLISAAHPGNLGSTGPGSIAFPALR